MNRICVERSVPFVRKADLDRLILAAELDDCFVICEKCGAWLFTDTDETATCDFQGCWYAATGKERDIGTCRSYRGSVSYRRLLGSP